MVMSFRTLPNLLGATITQLYAFPTKVPFLTAIIILQGAKSLTIHNP